MDHGEHHWEDSHEDCGCDCEHGEDHHNAHGCFEDVDLHDEKLTCQPPSNSERSTVVPDDKSSLSPCSTESKSCPNQVEICSACCGHCKESDSELCKAAGCKPHLCVKTKLSIRNICCETEVRLIKRLLEPMNGVESVNTSPFTKTTVVVHCPVPCCSSPEAILQKLNDAGFGAALLGQAGTADASEMSWLQLSWQHIGNMALLLATTAMLCGALLRALSQASAKPCVQLWSIL